MIVQCHLCSRVYDDAKCWTLCDHGPLEELHEVTTDMGHRIKNYCHKCDTLTTRQGPCTHQLPYYSNAYNEEYYSQTYPRRLPIVFPGFVDQGAGI